MNSKLSLNSFFIGTIFLIGTIAPAVAHNVKTDGNVGATFHIEPNHNPRAGDQNRAWFALTHQGGELISLQECDCQLAVYSESDANNSAPILTPPLKPISVEQYQNIPGADIIFPKAGIYQLTLSGKPKDGEDFKPFKLTYTVTASPGTANLSEQPTTEAANSNQTTSVATTPAQTNQSGENQRWGWLITAGIGGVIGIMAAISLVSRKGRSEDESN